MGRRLDYVVVDVFTDTPLQGNALAVFTDAAGLDAATMQRLARELNLSETVFIEGPRDGDGAVGVRIFTPAVELPFAGHPVLGAACVVGRDGGAATVRLATGSGIVPVALRHDGARVTGGEMEQPIPTWAPFPHAPRLRAALGVPGSELPVEVYDNGPRHVYVVLGDDAQVAGLAPDLTALAALGPIGVSCLAVDGARVHTRMFGPALGVAEDPATGSAAGPLAVHLARHGAAAFGTRLSIRQGAEIGRSSLLEAVAEGSGDRVTRVAVAGDAVIVAEGSFRLDTGVGSPAR